MRWLVLFIVSFLFVINISQVRAEQDFNYIDLNNWSPVGGAATWEIVPGGRTVKQTANTSQPTFYVSDIDYMNVIVRGTILFEDSDDDFAGFVLGFQEDNSFFDFNIIEWGKSDRTAEQDGAMILGNFVNVVSGFAISSTHQAYTRYHSNGTFEEYSRLNTGWQQNKTYSFEILYTPTIIRVFIDGVEFVSKTTTEENPFESGKFGFYGNSQQDVEYGNIRVVNVTPGNDLPQAANDTYGLVTSNGITLNVGANEGLLFNDYDPQLDAFEIVVTSQPAIGELSVVTSSGAFVYTSAGIGEHQFKYKLRELNSELESEEATVTLLIRDEANVSPSNILFTPNYAVPSIERNVVVGTLETIDANLPLDFHDLILTDNDSGQFGINGNQIIFADTSNLTPGAVRTIGVRSTDFEGAFLTTNVSIKVPEFTVHYNVDGGINHPSNPGFFNATNASITLLNPTKENFEFLGWFDALRGGTTVTAIDLSLATDVAVYARWAFATPDALQNQDPLIQPTITEIETNYEIELALLYPNPNRTVNLSYSTDSGINYTSYAQPFTVTTLSGLTFKGVDDLNNSRVITDASLIPVRIYHRSSTLDELGYEDFYVSSAGAISSSDLFNFKNFTFKHFSQSNSELVPVTNSTQEMYAIWDKIYEINTTFVDDEGVSSTAIALPEADEGYEILSRYVSNGSIQYTVTDPSITTFVNLDIPLASSYVKNITTGHYYYLNNTTLTYTQARDFCVSLGGYLATVTSLAEHQFLTSNVINSNTNIWIGGNDIVTEGAWVWENNEGLINFRGSNNFNLWASIEPNNSGGDQDGLVAWYAQPAADYVSEDGWDDQATNTTLKSLCEFNENVYQSSSPVTITTRYVVENYTLNLNPSGGAITSSTLQMGYNANLVNLPTPSRTGYTFVDWVDVNQISASQITISENITLTAVWRVSDYTITLDVAGGEPEESITGPYESAIRLPAAKRPGYTLLGWYLGNQRIPYTTTVPLGDQTYTARWEANLYTLTMTNTINDETSTITAAYDSPIVVPLYTLEGYTFKGWFEGGTNVSFNRMPLGDRTIRAIMEPNPFTITFDTQGAPAIASLTAPYMSDISLPIPEYENHTFEGWLLNGEKATLSTMPLNGATLVASWVKDEQTITFTSSVGNAPAPITSAIGEEIALPTMSVPGYTFDGWFEGETPVNLTTMPELPVTLTARFTRLEFTLRIEGFEGRLIQNVTREFGASIALPSLEIPGYLFSGWTLNGNAIRGTSVSMPAGGGTVRASFLPILYPVTFNHLNKSETTEAPFDSVITLPSSSVTGYAFIGWQVNGSLVESVTVPLGGVTLEGLYEPFTTFQTIKTPLQTISLTHTTDEAFNGPNLAVPNPLIFRGYYSQPFGLGERLTSNTISLNGAETRAYPYVVNPTVSAETRDTRTLMQGEWVFSAEAPQSPEVLEPDMQINAWISLATWSGLVLSLGVILWKEGRHGLR